MGILEEQHEHISQRPIKTLPVGPVRTIEEWYAQARLAVNVCTLIVLGSSAPPGGLALSYVSRCMDKDSLYSLSIMKHFLSSFFVPQRTKQLTVWSDVGKHFQKQTDHPDLGIQSLWRF